MSHSNWLHRVAVRRSLVATLFVVVIALSGLFAWSFWPPEPSLTRAVTGTQAEYLAEMLDGDCLALLAAPPPSDPNPKQTEDCADKAATQKKNYTDLTQSVRAANAAEHATYLSYLQTCIGIIGALLVTASLFFTAGATLAAARAAQAAEAAVTVQREIGEAETRAYLVCDCVEYTLGQWVIEVVVTIRNTGNSPADPVMVGGNLGFSLKAKEAWEHHAFWFNQQPCPTIPGGGTGIATVSIMKTQENARAFDRLLTYQGLLSFTCSLNWVDVFKKSQFAHFYFADIDKRPDHSYGTPVFRHVKSAFQESNAAVRRNKPDKGLS